MIEETKRGYEVPVPGATHFITTRTLIEAEGVVAGLQGVTAKSNPYPVESSQYWRWESGRDKAQAHLALHPYPTESEKRGRLVISGILAALAIVSGIVSVVAMYKAWG